MVKIIKTIVKDKQDQEYNRASEELQIEEQAWQSGFYKRKPGKLTATGLILGFWKMQRLGKNNLRTWALQAGSYTQKSLCKQSLNERLDQPALTMVKSVLKRALNRKKHQDWLEAQRAELGPILSCFNRIIIHDSTIQSLPINLADDFPGNYSHGYPTALFRLQALFNFSEQKWEDFSLDSYSKNDQSQARWPFAKLQKRDLLLRDLGFFTLDSIAQLIENQFIITRWRSQTSLFTPEGEKIDLLTLLQGKKQVDMPILLGSKKRIPMRLVARKLPKKQAAKRIEEARNDRHGNANHSEQYYELLNYEIYLTNIPEKILNAKQIAKLYGLRWYIEILFKSWKSYFNFKKMFRKDRMKYYRAVITIYILLIQFIYLSNDIYQYIHKKINETSRRYVKLISPFKFLDVINTLFDQIIAIRHLDQLDPLICQFERHACYQRRNDRQNMMEKYLYFKELCIKHS